MKTVVLTGIISMALAAAGLAGIGDDRKQVEAHYGQPGKDMGEHGNVHEIGYVLTDFLVVVSYVNGVSQREGFSKPDMSPLSDQEIKNILSASAPEGTSWQEGQAPNGDKMWSRSDKKAVAIFPSMGKFLFVQDVNFVQPK